MLLDVFPFVSRQSLRRRLCGRRRHGRRTPVTAWIIVERLEDRSLLSPTVTAPAAISVNGYSTLLFAAAQWDGITMADSAAGSNTDSLALNVNEGALALGSTTGLSFPSGSNGSGSMTISGTLTNLNAALNQLVYTPKPGYVGIDTLQLTITDSGDNLTGSAGVLITVNPVDPPAVSALKAISVNEDSTLLFTPADGDGITLADSVPGPSDAETLTLTAPRATLALGSTTGLTFTVGSDNSNSMTVSGTLANLNAGLDRLVYTPNLNDTGPDTLSVSLGDPIDGMTGSANVAITVNPVGPPTVAGPIAISVNEDSTLLFTPNNQDGITLADSVPGTNGLESLSLTASKGTLALGSTAGLTFPAGADDTGGITISGTLTALDAALNQLVYTPHMGYNGLDTLHVSLDDPVDTFTGSAAVALTVNPASPPTMSAPAAISVNEYSTLVFATSQGDAITLGDAVAVDNEALTLSVSHGTLALGSTSGLTFTAGANDSNFMTISGTPDVLDGALNRLVYMPNAPYNGPDTLQLSFTDPGDGLTGTASVAITVSPAPATQLAFVSLPTTGTAGQPLSPVAVELEDSFGNLVTSDNSNVTLTAAGPGGFSGSSTTTVAATGGIATFSNLVFDAAGNETLTASDPTDRLPVATSTGVTINPASVARLVFLTQLATGTAGQPLGSVAVELQDPFGNLVTSDSSNVTLTAAGPGSFTGTSTTTVAATGGVATFSSLVLDTAGAYTLTASDPADGLPVVTSGTLTISPAVSAQLVFQNVPATGLAGQAYPLTFDVLVEDQFGNVETSDNSDIVQVSIASGPVSVFNVQGATNVTTYTAQVVQGDAHFGSAVDLYFATAGVYQLEADDASTPAPATSGSISIEPLPVVNVPTAVSVNENSVFTFSSGKKISVTDLAGGPNTNETLTLNVSNGTVSLAAPSGLTVAGSGTAVSPLTVSGSLANLDADLAAGVIYKPGSNYTGPDVLDLAILDTNDQAQGATTAVPITVTPLPPAISVPTAVSVNENSSVTFSGGSALSVTDTADGGNNNQTLTLTVGNGTLSLPISAGLIVTDNGTDSLTLSGPLSALNSDLPGLIYSPTTGSHASDTLSLSDQDVVDTLTGANSVSITVNPLPSVIGPATASVIENASLTFSTATTNAFTVTDAAGNGNDAVTLTVSASNGTVSLAAPGGLTVAGSGTAASPLTVSGSLANLNADLAAGLVYKPGSDYTGPDVLDLAILDTTDQAPGAAAAIPITVHPLPPAISAPTAVSVNENSSITFSSGSAISVTDTADGGNNNQTLTLTVGKGTLSLPSAPGLTVTGNETDSLTLSGPLSALNSDLPGLVDTPTTGSHGSDTLTLSDQDLVDTLTGTNSVPITVNPLPSVNGPATASVIENASLTFSTATTNAISVTDAAGNGNDAVTLTVSASNGTVSLAAPTGLTVKGSGTAAAPLTLSGSLALLNADLAAGLIFKPNSNFSGPDVVDLSILDTSDQAQGSTATLLVTVSPLPPTITTPAPLNVNQNATLTLSGASAISVNDLGGTTEQLTASVLHGTLTVGPSSGLTITGNGTASLVLTGGLTALNTDLAGLVYTPTSGFNGTETLSLSDKDLADNLMATGSVTITVNPLPPTVSAPASAGVNQNATLPLTGLDGISVADRSGTAETLTLSVLDGALNVTTTTGLTVSGDTTAVVTLTGPLSALDTDLASAVYTPTTGYNGRDTLSLSDTDTADGLIGTGSVAITVNALPPTISAPTTVSLDENSSIALTGGDLISVGDLSGTAEQLTLSVLHGTFNLGVTAGLTVSGNNTASLTLSGPLADLNADLAHLSYTPTTGYNGPDTLSLSDKDTADTLAASASVPITVNPLPPTVNAPPAVSVNENGSVTFSGPNTISVTDTAGGGNENQMLTLSVGNGTLSLPNSAGLIVTGNGTASLTLSGPLSALNTDLVTLVYAPTSGSQSPDTLFLSDQNTVDTLTGHNNSVAITVNPLPLITGPASASVNQNGSLTFSMANGNQISVTDAAGSGDNTVTLTLEVSNGTLVLTAPTDVKASGTGTAGSPLIVTGSVTILNADLAAGLAYKPTTGYSGADVLGLMILDTADGAQGPVDAISITVNPLPAVSVPAAITVAKNTPFAFVGAEQLSVVDPANSGTDTVTVTLVVNNGTLALNNTNNLTFLSGNGTPTSPLVFTGTVSDVNADLADGLVYTPASGFTGSDNLSVSIFDSTDQAQVSTSQVPITVTP